MTLLQTSAWVRVKRGPLWPLLVALWLAPIAACAEDFASRLVEAARAQIGVTTGYDGSYRQLDYPGGDLPLHTGVCTDVLVRAYRALGIDLQVAVHEDMRPNFADYPPLWGLTVPDRNIDHRRVPNLETYFARHAVVLDASADAGAYRPGDVVSWRLDSGLPHIGIVSDRRQGDRPLVIHNIGAGTQEEDILFAWRVNGHYRYPRD
ncbi:MAG TPA: DUF1287 domain-containing protein [Xanthomonadaceae bacterium]|nr:DUF1287 domain-containing protein [Xanthomonadaceae bacterium]